MNKNTSSVCVCTPLYDGKITEDFFLSSLEYSKCKNIEFSYLMPSGDSLITRIRNYIITKYYNTYKDNALTHLLWQDSDVYIPAIGVESMINRSVDVVAAPVPIKDSVVQENGIRNSVVGIYEEVEPLFYKAKFAATGAMLLSNKAVCALIDYAKNNNDIYYDKELCYDVFRVGTNKTGFYLSEDWFICQTLRNLGFEIYIDSSFGITHFDSPRSKWHRPGIPLSENILNGNKLKVLPEKIRSWRWSTNDFTIDDSLVQF